MNHEALHSIENKENVEVLSEKKSVHKSDKKLDKVFLPQQCSGSKRNLEELLEGTLGESKSLLSKMEKKIPDASRLKKNRIDKSAGKVSCGKILSTGKKSSMKDTSEYLKEICANVDDLTNKELDNEEIKKKVKC